MCNVWIEQIHNWSGTTFTADTTDGTWWPVVNGHKYRGGQYHDSITIDAGASMNCQYFLVPFIEFGRLRLQGPAGGVNFSVGPVSAGSNDFLRGLGDQDEELLNVEMGPQGGNFWAASVALHIIIGPTQGDGATPGVRFLVWSANAVGPGILSAAGQVLLQVSGGLWQALVAPKAPQPSS